MNERQKTEVRRQKSDIQGHKTELFRLLVFCLSSVLCLLFSSAAFAADFSLHGFVQGNYSRNTETDNPDGGDYKLSEEHAQIKLDASQGPFHIFIKSDAFHENIDKNSIIESREGYLDYAAE